jgi:hypothetical protein
MASTNYFMVYMKWRFYFDHAFGHRGAKDGWWRKRQIAEIESQADTSQPADVLKQGSDSEEVVLERSRSFASGRTNMWNTVRSAKPHRRVVCRPQWRQLLLTVDVVALLKLLRISVLRYDFTSWPLVHVNLSLREYGAFWNQTLVLSAKLKCHNKVEQSQLREDRNSNRQLCDLRSPN